MIYARESFTDIEGEIELFTKHAEELKPFPHLVFSLDRDFYRAVEQAGSLRIYTARDERLYGYAVFLIRHHPHFRASLWAFQDSVYLDSSRRGRLIGWRLLKFCDEQLRSEGVEICLHTVDVAHPQLGELLNRIDYRPCYIMHGKKL